MTFNAELDNFGNPEAFTSDKIRKILDLLDNYMGNKPYTIVEMWQDNVKDANDRIDVSIKFENDKGFPIRQKLLILKGELIDGVTFHKRYKEWYD